MRRCGKCGNTQNIEKHHIAKIEFFGKDADKWPTVWLCSDCHQELHAAEDEGRNLELDSNEFLDKLFGVGIVREPKECEVVEA